MEAQPRLHQRLYRAVDFDHPCSRGEIAGDELEQGRFTGSVAADNADTLAALDFQVDAVERLESFVVHLPPKSDPRETQYIQRLFRQAVVKAIVFEIGRASCRERVCQYV